MSYPGHRKGASSDSGPPSADRFSALERIRYDFLAKYGSSVYFIMK